jgi:hypothetical protein
MTNIPHILTYGAIVAASDESGCLVNWNGSATFNFWTQLADGSYQNVDVMTVYGVTSLSAAEKIAEEWIADESSAEPDED